MVNPFTLTLGKAYVNNTLESIINQPSSVLSLSVLSIVLLWMLLVLIALYLYIAFAWMTIAKKLKYKEPWLAFIPIVNLFLIPILADKKWTWGFIFIVPFVFIPLPILCLILIGVAAVFYFIWTWKIFKKRKYPGWLALLPLGRLIPLPIVGFLFIIAYLVVLGLVAWEDRK